MSNNYAHLNADSEWRAVFPTGAVPIIEIPLVPPKTGNMDGPGQLAGVGPQEFYRVDLQKCTPEQFRGIVELLARKSGCVKEEVEAGIKQQGCLPLTMRHVSGTSTDSIPFL